jgi:hypothetical protein
MAPNFSMPSLQQDKTTKVEEAYCCLIARRRNGPAAPDQVPVISSFDFN